MKRNHSVKQKGDDNVSWLRRGVAFDVKCAKRWVSVADGDAEKLAIAVVGKP